MGALAANGIHVSNGINGTASGGVNGHLANVVIGCATNRTNGATSEDRLSMSSFTDDQNLDAGCQSHQRIDTRDSLSIAKALRYVPRQDEDILDMVCIGFGPASLAIAIALVDAFSRSTHPLPRVLFLEKQEEFAWHSGMQLPSAKMQISFLKDLATPRDPTSPYSFINYLHSKGRLIQFINLGTFLPTRLEYEDYMRWCADHFEEAVKYGTEVVGIEPYTQFPGKKKARGFNIRWRDASGTRTSNVNARHVIFAAGGEPHIPEEFKPFTASPCHRVKHSSQYLKTARVLENLYRRSIFLRRQRKAAEEELAKTKLEIENGRLISEKQSSEMQPVELNSAKKRCAQQQEHERRIVGLEHHIDVALAEEAKCDSSLVELGLSDGCARFVVVGNGQSAAEIFNDLITRFPDSAVSLVIKDAALRPSDDSPFVNEIFDPARVDDIYNQTPEDRRKSIALDKATNYGVVRLELLEHIYEQLYIQRVQEPDPARRRCKIITNRKVNTVNLSPDNSSLILQLAPSGETGNEDQEELVCDHVFVATGYTHDAYREILKDTRSLLPDGHHDDPFTVRRDYGVQFDEEKIDRSAGVWLQGCNESTHGLSDTLLSILAVRGGEIVESIFGNDLAGEKN